MEDVRKMCGCPITSICDHYVSPGVLKVPCPSCAALRAEVEVLRQARLSDPLLKATVGPLMDERDALRARVALLEKAVEAAKLTAKQRQCTYGDEKVKDCGCSICYLRASLDALKEGK